MSCTAVARMRVALMLCAVSALTEGVWSRAVPTQTNRRGGPAGAAGPIPDRPFLLVGRVASIDGSYAMIRTPDHGPGLQHGPGIHSMAIVAGRTFAAEVSHAKFQTDDGTPLPGQRLAAGDGVIALVSLSPVPYRTGRHMEHAYRAALIIRGGEDQTR